MSRPMRFILPFAALSGLGLLGILSLLPTLGPALAEIRWMPGTPDLPDTALALLALVQPTILLLAATAAGVALAGRAGLRSILLSRLRGEAAPGLGPGLPGALALGAALGVGIVGIDLGLRLATDPAALASLARAPGPTGPERVAALLYGGITEELMLRFGLMTLLVCLGRWALPGLHARRPGAVAWPAIAVTALLFGVGHLPKLFATATPGPLLIVQIVALNALAGLAYGWLFWRRTLEHAMAAHMATHVGMWAATPVLLPLAARLA